MGPSSAEFERLWCSIGSGLTFFGLTRRCAGGASAPNYWLRLSVSPKEMGARNAALETFEWQAPRFYQKHGYEEVARLEGYVKDFYLALMKKAL